MSMYPSVSVPVPVPTTCGDPECALPICQGPESHSVKKPWFMTQKPVLDPKKEVPPPIQLMKVDEWVLEKFLDKDIESTLWQYCPSTQWKKQISITEIRAGYCNSCCETIPEEIVAAYTMHNWNMLQQYDYDMKKYGANPYDPVTVDTDIKVYR